jgi:hypothetical protein
MPRLFMHLTITHLDEQNQGVAHAFHGVSCGSLETTMRIARS